MGFIKRALKSVIKSFVKISRPVFTFEDNQLKFKIDLDKFYIYNIDDNYETKTRHDPYVNEAYTLTTEDLFIEYIKVDHDVTWDGLPSSHFISLFKERLGIKNMDLLEKYEYEGYDFVTYKIDNHFVLNFIYIYELQKDVFILDIKSELYTNLLKNFDSKYVYKYDKNEESKMAFDISLVKENAFKNYFRLDND